MSAHNDPPFPTGTMAAEVWKVRTAWRQFVIEIGSSLGIDKLVNWLESILRGS